LVDAEEYRGARRAHPVDGFVGAVYEAVPVVGGHGGCYANAAESWHNRSSALCRILVVAEDQPILFKWCGRRIAEAFEGSRVRK
jgi:hypothetical protein